ncbi:SurA N-terminal domain-containing protein [Metabacillus idriensis]|uniref:peptidylprolyl isomerase n=1 Tax=Metabacillus idriensis TaxID=324768 RepID=A0A6I2M5R9_9BACI|nr:SurA N-terminal domain-containing protein [Metabacillus idriensis]MCM3595115.1 SurA N-terminal domain-containing protein [Metabacillus idriensis]MRX52857.1 peptidylprolyl isomerase [Metabacillus idriensis]OHR65485.1 peptidylprolyl isomerase [Bacillus sp. HMSC76G11]
MKKVMLPLITGLMAVVLAACGGNEESKEAKNDDKAKTAETDEQKDQQKQMEEMQKKLEKQQVDEKKTVALVNDEKILGADYNSVLQSTQGQMQQMGQDPTSKEAAEQVKKQTLDSLVGQTLLLQEADKKGYKASDEDVKKQLDETKKQFKTEKEFEAALKKSGMDMKTLEAQIADDIKFRQYIEKEVPAGEISNEEIQKTYDQYAEQGKSSGQEVPKLEEVKPQIEQSLQQQKQQEKLAQKVEELKKSAKIDLKI